MCEFVDLSCPCVCAAVCGLVCVPENTVSIYLLTVSYLYMRLCVWFMLCVCLAPCALYILGVCHAHPVCMVRLQPNGGGQSKMPGSFLLPPPPPVARPVPLPMPDSKIITPTDGGLSSPASPCKSPPLLLLHKPPLLPQTSHRGQSEPMLDSSRRLAVSSKLICPPLQAILHQVC